MDNVADSLIRIKNSYISGRKEVVLSYSKLIVAICQVLKEEGYLVNFEVIKNDKNGRSMQIKVVLRYEDKKPVLTDVKRISKPGLRIYKGRNDLPRVLNGLGIAIVSTPKGVMTDKQARKEGVGGEIMAYVW